MNNTSLCSQFDQAPLVQVLLATYVPAEYIEGARFLKEQVDSILQQNYAGQIEIIIRDDGSTCPNTLKYLEEVTAHYPNITKIHDDKGNLGFVQNFETLLESSTADYVFFADQDDQWLPNKIFTMVQTLQFLEKENSPDTPIMVHHNYATIDSHGKILSPSREEKRKENLQEQRPEMLLFRWSALGFSIAINNALREKLLPFTGKERGHDIHVQVTSGFLGIKHYIPAVLANYRIHDNNVSFPDAGNKGSLLQRIKSCSFSLNEMNDILKEFSRILTNVRRRRKNFLKDFNYAGEMAKKHAKILTPEQSEILTKYSKMAGASIFERYGILNDLGLFQRKPKMALLSMMAPRQKI